MKAFYALLSPFEGNPPISGGFGSRMSRNAGFGAFFDVRLKKRLKKQWNCRWFEMPWRRVTMVWVTMDFLTDSQGIRNDTCTCIKRAWSHFSKRYVYSNVRWKNEYIFKIVSFEMKRQYVLNHCGQMTPCVVVKVGQHYNIAPIGEKPVNSQQNLYPEWLNDPHRLDTWLNNIYIAIVING